MSKEFFLIGSAFENEILDHLPLGLFVIAGNHRVEYWNRWMEDYTQIKREEILGRDITEAYPNIGQPKYLGRIDAILNGAPPTVFSSLLHKYIIPIQQKNGEYRIQNTTVIPIHSPAGESFALFAIHDVTDLTNRINESRSMRDRAMELKVQAEEATKLKDKFISLVSHDLKNPLTSMLGFMQIIAEEGEMLSKDELKAIATTAVESGNNMRLLIDDILSLSRIKGGKMALTRRFIDLGKITHRAILGLQPLADKKSIFIDAQIPAKTRVFADSVFLEQVMHNLIGNAIKFCNEGNTVKIYILPGEPSTICVADNGVGIQFTNIDDIFKHERKTSTPGTAGETGTGFGLPLSRDIVEAHGGSLTVQSEPGKGSSFFVRLPDVKPVVMIVDDEKLVRSLLKKSIEHLDVQIVEAGNGKEAMEAIEKSPPNLIITDLVMPVSDGYDLIKNIRGNSALRKLPIIVITSDTSLGPREKALQLGADDFVRKESDPNDFIFRVSKYVGQ